MQSLVCQQAIFASNPYCRSHSIWKGILSSVLPPLLLTLWQNLCMPQLIYRGTQVHVFEDYHTAPSLAGAVSMLQRLLRRLHTGQDTPLAPANSMITSNWGALRRICTPQAS